MFTDCDLTEATTSGAVFDRCEFLGAAFHASVHDTTRFDKATFRGANLVKATLRGASIDGAVFTGADLSGVQLAGLDWRRTRVDGQLAMQIAESLGATIDAPWPRNGAEPAT
ncbi:uncharacterized protein YjbI with pentapeptide repeats [Marisediminicola sp. UYEF4]|uniref:pentapeptide repeat-containing protein n=1 Tax=Marisediminicola sp. UYEF4 TaxID=1756384 RepID=UPI0033956711